MVDSLNFVRRGQKKVGTLSVDVISVAGRLSSTPRCIAARQEL